MVKVMVIGMLIVERAMMQRFHTMYTFTSLVFGISMMRLSLFICIYVLCSVVPSLCSLSNIIQYVEHKHYLLYLWHS